jgi:monoamine oxidase
LTALTRRTFLAAATGLGALALAGCAPGPLTTGRIPSAPIAFARTSWSRDPFALGSYSFLAPSELGTDARAALAAPVGRVFFAGEATSSSAPATTHGAVDSGLRAAADAAEVSDTVVVIGAGLAGLAAARALIDDGVEVVIVEARDRVGGRAHTVNVAGTAADLGPSWVHGVTDNVVAEFADDAGIELVPFDYDNAVGSDDDALAEIEKLAEAALEEDDPEGSPLADLLPDTLTPEQRWALSTEIAGEFGADADELALAALDEGDEQVGGDALVAGGYGPLAEAVADGLTIELGWVVAAIEHDADGVTVVADDGRRINADSAIVTLPLGVLQAGTVAFDPPLPASTTAAIGALGMGLLDKLWLTFDEVFWNAEAEVIHWIDPDDPGLWGFWVNGYAAFGTPSLLTFVAGSRAREMADWSDDEVVASAMSALRRMT